MLSKLIESKQTKQDNLLEQPDEIYSFYQYLLKNDISCCDYAELLRQTFKAICVTKGVNFEDLDEQNDIEDKQDDIKDKPDFKFGKPKFEEFDDDEPPEGFNQI